MTTDVLGDVRLKDSDVLNTGAEVIISMKNVHKTYLLGVEGIPALRFECRSFICQLLQS